MTPSEPSLGQLISQSIADVQMLVKDQIELTKVEVSKSVKEGANSAAFFIVAGVLAFLGFVFLLVTLACVLHVWLSWWLSFLIVTVLLIVVAAIFALLGKKRMEKARSVSQKAIASAQTTAQALQSDVQGVIGAATTVPGRGRETPAG